MRLWTNIATLCFSLISLMNPQYASAGELPYGSYLESCINVHSTFFSVSAWCRTNSNHWPLYSRLSRVDRCLFVENRNGKLVCTRRFIAELPAGSYLDSCHHCQYDGENLNCSCVAKPGYFLRQEVLPHADRCRSDIGYNRNGLQCLKRPIPEKYRRVEVITVPAVKVAEVKPQTSVLPPKSITLNPHNVEPSFAEAVISWTKPIEMSVQPKKPVVMFSKNKPSHQHRFI